MAPYAVRAKPAGRGGRPGVTPLRWDELDDVEPQRYTIDTLPPRLDTTGDPWTAITRHARSLARPRRTLRRLRDERR